MSIDWLDILDVAHRVSYLAMFTGPAWVGCKLLYRKGNFVQSSALTVRAGVLIAVATVGGALLLLLATGREPNFGAERQAPLRIALQLMMVLAQLLVIFLATRKPEFYVVGYPQSSASRLFAIAAARSGGSVNGPKITFADTGGVIRLRYVAKTPLPVYAVESDPGNAIAEKFAAAVVSAAKELPRPVQTGFAWFSICFYLWMTTGLVMCFF